MNPSPNDPHHQQKGAIATAASFIFWGTVVIYWKQLEQFTPFEINMFRVIGSLFVALVAITFRGTLSTFIQTFSNLNELRFHLTNGLLLLANWSCFIYAVSKGYILQASLAYFMVPILNTAMGFVFLKEKLTKLQWCAISLAALGITNEIIQFGKIPWLALVIALTFTVYGMNKNQSKLGPLTSLTMEMTLLTPVAIIAIILLKLKNPDSINVDPQQITHWLWIFSTGLVTVVPLVVFAYGVRRIQLTSVGLFQFFTPSISFLIGVFMYGEDFSTSKMITFAFIWAGLALYLIHLFGNQSQKSNEHPE